MIKNLSIILVFFLLFFFKIRVVTVTQENFNPGLTNQSLNCFKEPNQLDENGSWETVSFQLFSQTTVHQAQLMEPQLKNRPRAQVPTVSLSTCAKLEGFIVLPGRSSSQHVATHFYLFLSIQRFAPHHHSSIRKIITSNYSLLHLNKHTEIRIGIFPARCQAHSVLNSLFQKKKSPITDFLVFFNCLNYS